MIDSRCGLHCTGCGFKESHGCAGCIESMGHPFHGECPIAICCQDKGFVHCGECDIMPCSKLYAYSYLDSEHGDRPPGGRIEVCRRWAAENGRGAWGNVLLTSAGWVNEKDGSVKPNIQSRFLSMLGKPARETKVLFIPTAAIDEESIKMAGHCRDELLEAGILNENITFYDLDGRLTAESALAYDAVYFTGGNTGFLLNRIKETGFDVIIRKLVYANKVYVGVSAGSIIAGRDISTAAMTEMAADRNGLALVNAYISVHCSENMKPRTDLPLPHITLTDTQALVVTYDDYELIDG